MTYVNILFSIYSYEDPDAVGVATLMADLTAEVTIRDNGKRLLFPMSMHESFFMCSGQFETRAKAFINNLETLGHKIDKVEFSLVGPARHTGLSIKKGGLL